MGHRAPRALTPSEGKVLVVDEDVAGRARVAAELRALGYSSVRAATVDLGSAIAEVNPDVALAILSLDASRVDPGQVLSRFRSVKAVAAIPVIVVGRALPTAMVRRLLAFEACRVVSAPLTLEHLRNHIEALKVSSGVSGVRKR